METGEATVMPCKESTYGELGTNGYYSFRRPIGGQRTVHRWVYSKHHNISLVPEQVVRHRCNNKRCIEVTHLLLGTKMDNERDKVAAGVHKGTRNSAAKLTEEDVLRIRKLYKTRTQLSIAKEYGVSRTTIGMIVTKDNWGWLK